MTICLVEQCFRNKQLKKTQTKTSQNVGEKIECTHVATHHKASNAHLHNGCVEYKQFIESVKLQQMSGKKRGRTNIYLSSQTKVMKFHMHTCDDTP
jgi:hypothetical protein